MTLVVVPFCAMLAPCSMLSRTPRAAPKERGAGSKIPLDNPSPIQGLELANVVFGKPLKYWTNCFWFQRTLWDLRPFAHELQ
jgi:hypothetical protein